MYGRRLKDNISIRGWVCLHLQENAIMSRTTTSDIRGRAADRVILTSGAEDVDIAKYGQHTTLGSSVFETLWTAEVDKTWAPGNGKSGMATELFYFASDNSADTSMPVSLSIVRSGYVQYRV